MQVLLSLVGRVFPVYQRRELQLLDYMRKNQQVTGALEFIVTILLFITFYTG
jgi:hypothetical protein